MNYVNEQYRIKSLMGILSEQEKEYQKVFSFVSSYASKHGNQRIHVTNNAELYISKDELSQFISDKPNGLWYAFGDSWVQFMKYNFDEYWYGVIKHAYVFEINKDNIIRIISKNDVIDFTHEFGDGKGIINWGAVKNKYSGIEMPTYRKFGFRNMHDDDIKYKWLYSWDIPSGCIWKPDGITKITKII